MSVKSTNLSASVCGESLWLFCEGPGCGERQMVAFGKNALEVESRPERIMSVASKCGWQVAPIFLCVNCKSKQES